MVWERLSVQVPLRQYKGAHCSWFGVSRQGDSCERYGCSFQGTRMEDYIWNLIIGVTNSWQYVKFECMIVQLLTERNPFVGFVVRKTTRNGSTILKNDRVRKGHWIITLTFTRNWFNSDVFEAVETDASHSGRGDTKTSGTVGRSSWENSEPNIQIKINFLTVNKVHGKFQFCADRITKYSVDQITETSSTRFTFYCLCCLCRRLTGTSSILEGLPCFANMSYPKVHLRV